MPGGQYDSSKTRVRPVFDALWSKGRDWLPDLPALPELGASSASLNANLDLTLLEGHWEPNEKGLDPPVSLLSWLIRNLWTYSRPTAADGDRAKLLGGNPEAIAHALRLLRSEYAPRAWYIFEGRPYPDVLLVANEALVVIEGKRTEPIATTRTSWLPGRHQIWRHLDAAWELRGKRTVYGFFIVEGEAQDESGLVPEAWLSAAANAVEAGTLRSSFPHRSDDETRAIVSTFLGVTTWRKVCARFDLDWHSLPHTVSGNAGE